MEVQPSDTAVRVWPVAFKANAPKQTHKFQPRRTPAAQYTSGCFLEEQCARRQIVRKYFNQDPFQFSKEVNKRPGGNTPSGGKVDKTAGASRRVYNDFSNFGGKLISGLGRKLINNGRRPFINFFRVQCRIVVVNGWKTRGHLRYPLQKK